MHYEKRCTGVKLEKLENSFCEHPRDAEKKKDDKDAPKPVGRHFNLPNYLTHNIIFAGSFPTPKEVIVVSLNLAHGHLHLG